MGKGVLQIGWSSLAAGPACCDASSAMQVASVTVVLHNFCRCLKELLKLSEKWVQPRAGRGSCPSPPR